MNYLATLLKVAQVLAPFAKDVGKVLFPDVAKDLQPTAGAAAMFGDPELVKALQGALNERLKPSPGLNVDGVYGPRTRDAVKVAQAALGGELKPDGWAGPKTHQAMLDAGWL